MPFPARLLCLIALLGMISLAVRGDTIDLTSDTLTPDTYSPSKILATANRLIALGEKDADASLLQYAEVPRDKLKVQFDFERDYYVAWLCLLVYEPKPDSALKMPCFGGPQFPLIDSFKHYTGTECTDWPLFPLAMNRDVPFLLVRVYMLGGECLPSSYLVKDYQAHALFRTRLYPLPSHTDADAALTDLLSSHAWKALSWHESTSPNYLHANENWEIEFLRQQVGRVK